MAYSLNQMDTLGRFDNIGNSFIQRFKKIIDIAFFKKPDSIVWAIRKDGILLGLTFL